ncbi:hypothetical protein [Paludibaculum fermentans]|uniref:hypothetical protein n=1 Tax=Paludibaculum fermentans TaxID=1473598 RepID=UPI003EC0C2E8
MRPLSLGEILDRTFSLYRRHFLLFAGISSIPSAIVLAFEVARLVLIPDPFTGGAAVARSPAAIGLWGLMAFVAYILSTMSYTVALAGIVCAVADLQLGRAATMLQSIRHVLSEFWSIIGNVWLSGVAVMLGILFFIFPGVYFACRLLVCLPAGIVEKRGPGDSITRSRALTQDFAGRGFLILLLYGVITYSLWIGMAVLIAAGPGLLTKDPASLRLSTIFLQLGGFAIAAIATPILGISASIFYFDLRVRKEAFDLQFMMNPDSERFTPSDRGLSLLP